MKVLIVEDELTIRNGLKKHVPWAELGITEVETAVDAKSALQICTDFSPDIVLSDIRMPEEDGITMCRKLREKFPDCEIIFISGFDDKEYLKAAIELRSICYIEKPIQMARLTDALAKAIERCNKNKQMSIRQKENMELAFSGCDLDSGKAEDGNASYAVRQVRNYIHLHYSDSNLTIGQLADYVGLSAVYLGSCWKRYIGMTIVEYVTKVRMEHAKRLLKTPKWKSYEVAYMVGYTDPKYFTRIFKNYTGKSPSEYRKELEVGEDV